MTGKISKFRAFDALNGAFARDIPKAMAYVEFHPSGFSNHHFGLTDFGACYTFLSLYEPDILDRVEFRIDRSQLSVMPVFNRYRLDRKFGDLSMFDGMDGEAFLARPALLTTMQIDRWYPVPFLYIPKPYVLKNYRTLTQLEDAVSKLISELSDELEHIDIIRDDWNTKHEMVEITLPRFD